MDSKLLKDYNKELYIILIINIGLYVVAYYREVGIVFEIIPIFTFAISYLVSSLSPLIFLNVLPSKFKFKLVGYDKLPSYSIFSDLKSGKIKEDKINLNLLRYEYGKIPEKSENQHKLWYEIYRKHEYNPRIFPNHRYAVMMRDFVTLNWMLILIMILSSLILQNWGVLLVWCIFMIFQILIEILICRRLCVKFISAVLIEEIYSIRKIYDYKEFTYA